MRSGHTESGAGRRRRVDLEYRQPAFFGAVQIVDVWHAREHLWGLAAKLFPSDEKQRKRWAKKLIQKLNRGRVESVVSELHSPHATRCYAVSFVSKPTTSNGTEIACATPNSASRVYS